MNKLQNNIALHKGNLLRILEDPFELFKYIFVGDATGRILSFRPGEWTTELISPSDQFVHGHLDQKWWGGSRYQKFTRHITLDFDDKPLDVVLRIRSMINATILNSMLCTSVSKDSYHLHLRLSLYDPLILITLIKSAFKPFTRHKLFELFPQSYQGCRYPFGKDQIPLDEGCLYLVRWEDQLEYFCNLNIYSLVLPSHEQIELDLGPGISEAHHRSPVIPVSTEIHPRAKPHRDTFRYSEEEVRDINVKGLTEQGTRDYAQTIQFIDQYRLKVTLGDATRFVMKFIRDHHNDLSLDYNRNPRKVFDHIFGQGKRIYKHLKKWGILPEDIHCADREFITEANYSILLDNCNANWPFVKFLTKAAVHSSSRQHREVIRIRWDLLKDWSNTESYLKNIDKLEAQGLGKRGSVYRHHKYSKYLMLNMPKMNPADAIYINGRPAKTAEEALMSTRTRAEARQLLKDKGFSRENAKKIVQRIYARYGDKTEDPVRSCGQEKGGEVKSPLSIPF